ncbi:hypothetical protein N5C66_22785 [Rhizobium pusense]|uniref:hypothetical protein n=1 Tax=Rhizobium/Agrobacterium group TaxID=227290 RepID=UPI000927BB62|nr:MULTISPECIES: hypothetical protein [Rhizobium/Agrobacterium group]MDH0912079.1 hypothetical protein [Agrobacterium pusense]MDH1098151.1 hypothetical protein [Agrobacterium pusense]MDH1114557.1 hypothetical protein [Agrobacterium pusense]MDH2196572.1 hypothetical protein [Agrobacterium pusense]OJH53428.1 hypothetical protein ATN81_18695 [Agrobacterium pusense]
MARVILDSCIIGEKWFTDKILPGLLEDENVTFTYTEHEKMVGELEQARKLQKIYKLMGDAGRRNDVTSSEAKKHIQALERNQHWQREEDNCDDPHIFAMVYSKPTRFVFTTDKRMGRCRDCMIRVINKRYSNFLLVMSESTYKKLRAEIHAA